MHKYACYFVNNKTDVYILKVDHKKKGNLWGFQN